MFDLKTPISISLLTLVVTFILSVGILYLAKPSWVQKVNKHNLKTDMSLILILSYSFTFSIVCAIASLLISSNKLQSSISLPQNSTNISYFPDPVFIAPVV